MANVAVGQFLVGLEEDSIMFADDPDNDDLDGSDRRGGVGEQGFPLGELEPKIVDVFGAGLDTPGSEGVGRQAGLEPIGEGLRGREAGVVGGFGRRKGHAGDSGKPARVERERDFGEGRESGGGGFRRRDEKEEGEGGEDEVWE